MNKPFDIDELMRQKTGEMPFEYEEAYWAAAQQRFAELRRRKRRRAAGILFLLLSAGLLTGGLWKGYRSASLQAERRVLPEKAEALHGGISQQNALQENYAENKSKQQAPQETTAAQSQPPKGSPALTATAPYTVQKSAPDRREAVLAAAHRSPAPQAPDKIDEASPARGQAGALPAAGGPEAQHSKIRLQGIGHDRYELTLRAALPAAAFSLPRALPAPRRLHPYFTAGAGVYNSWAGADSATLTRTVSPFAGAGISWPLSRRIRLSAGLQYSQRKGLNRSTQSTQTSYGFAYTRSSQQLDALSLHQLQLQVQAGLRFSPRQMLYAGASTGALLNVRSRLRSSVSGPLLPETPPGDSRVWNYREGWAALDYGLLAGYQLALWRGLEAGLRYEYGLRDLSLPDAAFRYNGKDHNHRLQVYFIYYLP